MKRLIYILDKYKLGPSLDYGDICLGIVQTFLVPSGEIEPIQLLYVTLNVSHIEDHKVLKYQPLWLFK